jgi:hypothetical protein
MTSSTTSSNHCDGNDVNDSSKPVSFESRLKSLVISNASRSIGQYTSDDNFSDIDELTPSVAR